MSTQRAYEDLIGRWKELQLLESCGAVLGWDERTYMPRGGAAHRAEQHALLAGLAHERATATEVGELLSRIEEGDRHFTPDSAPAVNVREIRREYDRRTKLPRSLVEAHAKATTLAEQAWQEAREKSAFGLFRPHFEEVLRLTREVAEALKTGGSAYDALLDRFEPGETSRNLKRVFGALRDELAPLVAAIVDTGREPDASILTRDYPVAKQTAFGVAAAAAIGFDFERGRLDETVHPFCTGIGPGDTRITTRYDRNRFAQAFFGTLHEAGHGLYDQGLDSAHSGTPMADAVSLGIHESQSRMWENFVGRGRAFWTHFFPKARDEFPAALADVSPDAFHFAINHVRPSFIRVEADEATYNLHILLRFALEEALVEGDLAVADVPGAWNERFEKDFSLKPPDDAHGCLQDVHWSAGLIGYFPTYTLGNLYAAQFFESARGDLGDLDGQFAKGEFGPLLGWLRDRIHLQGKRYPAPELVEAVTGKPLGHRALMTHLKARFGPLYGV
ncbi:MAG: carboxypeptidase M32 [Gemmatimonadota bacterium]|nr:carboxypeptidase M32 [Gemmatimonadota bacterium]